MTAELPKPSGRRWRSLASAAIVGCGLGLASSTGAFASEAGAPGPDGQTVTLSKAAGIDEAGEAITVRGEGFDVAKGVYVMVCVSNGEGAAPDPCFGGEGEASESAAWVSSNPPSYAEGQTTPFNEDDGSFEIELTVAASDGADIDCMAAPEGCVVATMADHTRPEDRSADVFVPVSFGDAAAEDTADEEDAASGDEADVEEAAANSDSDGNSVTWAIVGGAAVVVLGGTTMLLVRRRKTDEAA